MPVAGAALSGRRGVSLAPSCCCRGVLAACTLHEGDRDLSPRAVVMYSHGTSRQASTTNTAVLRRADRPGGLRRCLPVHAGRVRPPIVHGSVSHTLRTQRTSVADLGGAGIAIQHAGPDVASVDSCRDGSAVP